MTLIAVKNRLSRFCYAVFMALRKQYGVTLEHMILKPNMVLPGKDCRTADPDEIAEATIPVFRRAVPAAVPSINFLSGGQRPEEATINLNAVNQIGGPWKLSISYGRALQHRYWLPGKVNLKMLWQQKSLC